MKQIFPALRIYLLLSVLLGLAYPLSMTVIGQIAFHDQANGQLISKDGVVIGSKLIEQKFEKAGHFSGRPSAVDFNPLPSGGSNLGPTSQVLKEVVAAREKALGGHAPQGLLFASGSGLDPEIDLVSALFQIPRVAQARGVPEADVRSIVLANLESRDLGFLGEERINVLKLNLALERK